MGKLRPGGGEGTQASVVGETQTRGMGGGGGGNPRVVPSVYIPDTGSQTKIKSN